MPSPRPSPGERAPSFERADRDERFRDADPARCRATGRASWPKPAPHPRLAHGRARRAARRRRPVRGARSRPPLHRAPARRARVRALLRQLDAHQVGVGRGRGLPRHAAGDRGWRLDPARARWGGAGAGPRLGLRPVIVDGGSTQVEHGETAEETGAMLGMNAHALGIRHDLILGEGNRFMGAVKQGIDDYLPATNDPRRVPVVNLQCDVDHPTQTLADLMWLRERFPDGLQGRKIAVSWAYSPSYAKPLSVPQGLAMLLTRYGAEVVLAHPEGYRLTEDTLATARTHAERSNGSFRVTSSMEDAFTGADAVYPKSWGPYDLMLDRVAANRDHDGAKMAAIERKALERNAGHRDWICDERRMGLTRNGRALYLHCLPADIGAEVSPGVME